MGCGGCSKRTAPLRVLKHNSGSPKIIRPGGVTIAAKRKLFGQSIATRPANNDNRV